MKTFFSACLINVVFLFTGYANFYAQVSSDSLKKKIDSTQLEIEYREYIVNDYRAYDFTSGIKTITIPMVLLQNNGSISSLSDALQTIGGVYMRSYGNGMNNAVTLRGFGPERTSTLWNGIALNNAGLGQLDMNLMPGGFFNSIKLIQGSSSTQYGNGAQGGSLLLEYLPNYKNKFNLGLTQEFGSFFTWNTGVQMNYGNQMFQGRTAFIRNSSNNNYAYKDKSTIGFPTRDTENSDYFSYQGMQDLFFRLKKGWQFSFHGWYNYTDRKTPPAMGAANNHSQQFDENIRVMTQLKKSFKKHEIQMQFAYINDKLIFHTDAFKDSSSIHSGQTQMQYIFSTGTGFTLMAGGNFSINYSEYKYYVNSVTELRGNVFALANINLTQLMYRNKRFRVPIKWSIKLSAGIRQQFSTHYISYPSAHIGLDAIKKMARNQSFYISGALNTAYRMPTLNDLYWVPGGNVNLKPEYSWNSEASLKYEWKRYSDEKKLNISLEAIGYFGRTSNWIQWIPTPLGYWTPQNITEVQSAGLESSFSFNFQNSKKWKFNFKTSYNFNHTTDVNNEFKQLIYVPEHSVKGNIELSWNEIYLNIYPSFISKRYTLSDNTLYIPSFFLLNLQAGYTLKLPSCNIGFYCRIGNVTHADYQMMLNRPMPGLNFNAGINFYLHK